MNQNFFTPKKNTNLCSMTNEKLDDYEAEVNRKLDKQLNNWKNYKDTVKIWSKDLKNTESYSSVAEYILKSITEGGDDFLMKDRLPYN